MSNNKAFKVKNGLELADYNKSISDTAVDVFVYDTRKDSDGGAWRKRTQGTSWYNETLNTATRGSRKEFPAVAVIVAESSQVTIYDGDDPDLPMWMVFNQGSGQHIGGTALTLTALIAINGGVYVTYTSGSYGYHQLNFLKDASFFHNNSGLSVRSLPILNRNEQNTSSAINTNGVINAAHNDVAMTVLPNAPIDAATGLPVPTIAVATDGGVSVIKDDGTVVDSLSTSVYYSVMFNGSDLYAEDTTFADDTQYYGDAGSLSDSFPTFRNFYSYSPSYERLSSSTLSKFSGNILTKLGTPRSFAVGLAADTASGASWTALNMVADHSGQKNAVTGRTALVSYINSSFNTGWMNGDIKLATLSDTDTTNVTGSELVTNGTFDSDTSGWTDASTGTGSISWNSSGYLQLNSADADNRGIAKQSFSTVVGKVYTFTFEQVAGTEIALRLGTTDTGSQYYNHPDDAVGIYATTFTATSTTLYITIYGPQSSGNTQVDNISVRLAEEDRSVNGNGLQVFGTVTKSAVATGADLVAYSGFSTSNYLEQPYNSDLDFGTGDFCVLGWYNTGNSTTTEMLLSRVDSGNVAAINCMITSSETLILQTRESSTSSTVTTTETAATGVWNCFAFVRRNSGTVQEVYINGKLSKSATVTARDVSSVTGKVYMGYTPELASNAKGSMALWRISATAPSPEQIKKIYEDEKVLFQDGAQATLYGSSDAVTALAYDDSTNLLHVGTSAGRSVFQGLRRVDNTTTAVGAAISASNGLVADE